MIQICTLKTPKNQACSSDHRVIFAGSQVVRFPWETLLEFGLIIRRYAATWAWVFVNGYLFPPKYWEIVCSWQKRKLEYWKQLWLSLIVAERESRVLEYDGKWREIHSHLVLLWFKIRGTFPRRSWSSDIVKFWHDAPITYFDFFVSLFVKTIFPQYCLQKVYSAGWRNLLNRCKMDDPSLIIIYPWLKLFWWTALLPPEDESLILQIIFARIKLTKPWHML